MGTCGAQHALICVGACTLVEMDIRFLVHARLRRITIPIQNASAYLPPLSLRPACTTQIDRTRRLRRRL